MKKIYFALLFLTALMSCRKAELVDPIEPSSEKVESLQFGKKLENPYSVKNMLKAYKNLTSGGNSTQNNPVYTTHYYVRFLPADTAQYNKLKNDTTLRMYPYPLDYEVGETGDYFGGDEDSPVWQYAAVKNDYQFDNNIQTEVLEELYIPDDDYNPNEIYATGASSSFSKKLVDEAMRITNNVDYIKKNINAKTNWVPQGTIRVFDTRLNQYIPLVGVKVSARRWFTTRETYTDANGQYSMASFSGPANYALWYETGGFDVRSGWFGQAWRNGPKQNTPWNVDIYDGVQRFYAHVFRGARRFFYGNTGGLRRPRTGFFAGKIKYGARDGAGSAQGVNYTTATQGGIFPDIQVWRFRNSGGEYASDEIFSTTVHETAHTTHMNSMNGPFELVQYAQVSHMIKESWPIAVEWYVTQMEYQERGISNYGTDSFYSGSYPNLRGYQYWNSSMDPNYTSLFIDIVDNYNQNSWNPGVMDNVNGYTLAYIESNLLKHCYGVSSLAQQLKSNKPFGVTDLNIDELLFGVSSSGLSQIAGIDIGLDDGVYFWNLTGSVSKGVSTNINGTVQAYALPSGKSYNQVIDMAIASSGKGYVWYNDGTMSVGYGLYNFGDFVAPKPYILPNGKVPSDIAGIAIQKSNDHCFAYYKDGTYSVGNSTNLGAYSGLSYYTISSQETYANIKDVGIATSSGKFYVWFADNKMSVGSASNLNDFIPLKSMD